MVNPMANTVRFQSRARLATGCRAIVLLFRCRTVMLFILIAGLLGCVGGSSGSGISGTPLYAGQHQASYTIVTDECGLIDEGEGGFTDVHTISQDGLQLVISSEAGFLIDIESSIDDEGGFVAREVYALEDPGFALCEVESALSYARPVFGNETSEDSVTAAESVFVFRLNCADGYTCETRTVGYVERIAEVQ